MIRKDKCEIPSDATCFEVFAIHNSNDSPTGKMAYLGFKLYNGDFHFVGVPYTGHEVGKQDKQNLLEYVHNMINNS